MVEYRKDVDDLLRAYAEYKELLQVEAGLSMQRARQKITGVVDTQLASDHEVAKRKLQSLSDSMTFADPLVWIMYKFEAYKNEAQPIRTLRDFRIHCSKVGDICTKRFSFVNHQLLQNGQPTLMDDCYDDSSSLDTLLQNESIRALVNDPMFMALWRKHEYNNINGQAAKWEGYSVAV